ncbi:MAG: hypothetical protein LBU55_01290 [Elusimicrobiota bacterium]|jgi:hypothetical protein|nr:hypothetical protein [Elusimicrobiota bacterium]
MNKKKRTFCVVEAGSMLIRGIYTTTDDACVNYLNKSESFLKKMICAFKNFVSR